ncbi:hypothetical protein QAD02_011046 [Eretmocerus hayati]|uniref:Uncharacterized protein n=1 Tax=Eretmocerus hayati TaxID=131215 RepID=A0ACC2NVP3_9HYME|nr:hypothetical protein QAD02_011046 [Eretmocerus hayati]
MSRRITLGKLDQPRRRWTWDIDIDEMCKQCKEVGDSVDSPKFIFGTSDGKNLEWLLRVYPMGNKEMDGPIAQLVSLHDEIIWLRFRLAITTTFITGEPFFTCDYNSGPKGDLFGHFGCEIGTELSDDYSVYWWDPDQRSGQMLNIDFNLDGIKYEIMWHNFVMVNDDSDIEGLETEESGNICESNVDQNRRTCNDVCASNEEDCLLKFIQDKKFGDVSIEVDGKIFRAHRVLLRSQSEAFAKIFGDREDDKAEKTISIDDVDHKLFTEILRFIYYKEVKGIQECAKDLLAAASKYSMEPLRKICVEEVSKSVTCENAIEYLQMIDQSELGELKKVVVEFVASNLKEISKSSTFASLKNVKSDLMFELIQALGNKSQ